MRYGSPAAFRAALEERLKTYAGEHDVPIVRLRKVVTFDRLLARLVAASPDRWILKGAMALSYRYGDRTRTTMDLDLAREGDEQAAHADLMSALAEFLDPVLDSTAKGAWNPDSGAWEGGSNARIS
jgi:hypothetical protein